MNWLNSIILSVCAASVCIGALYIICPTGKISKSVRYTFSLCFLLILISSVGITIKKSDLSFDIAKTGEINTEEIDIAAAEYTYGLALKNAGINFSKIEVLTDNSNGDSIVISRLVIYSDNDRQRILSALGSATENFEVVVINE